MVNMKTIAAGVILVVLLGFGGWTIWNSTNQTEDIEFLVIGMMIAVVAGMIF